MPIKGAKNWAPLPPPSFPRIFFSAKNSFGIIRQCLSEAAAWLSPLLRQEVIGQKSTFFAPDTSLYCWTLSLLTFTQSHTLRGGIEPPKMCIHTNCMLYSGIRYDNPQTLLGFSWELFMQIRMRRRQRIYSIRWRRKIRDIAE